MKSILFLCIVLSFVGCQTSIGTKERSRLDTFPVAKYSIITPSGKKIGPFVDTAINKIIVKFEFKDTTNGTGYAWISDTSHFGRVSDDTLRDALRKPIYDSLKRVQWHYVYWPVPDSLITVVTHLQHSK